MNSGSRSRTILAGLVTAACTVSTLALTVVPASAAEGNIESVSCESDAGGYTPYLAFGCNFLRVTIGDSTPSESSAYMLNVDTATFAPFTANVDPDGPSVDLFGYDPIIKAFVPGTTYPVSVSETGSATTPSFPFVYDLVTAPTAATPVLTDGGYKTGVKSSVQLDGSWEAGAIVQSQVVANVGGTRPDAVQNAGTEISVASVYDATTNTVEFTLPAGAAGRFIWVSVIAQKSGKATNGLNLAPVKATATATPTYDRSWVRSFGSRTGTAKVGKRVGVTAPVFRNATVKASTRVTYRWFKNDRAVPGATDASLRLTRAMRGKRITLKQSFAATGYKRYVRSVNFGRVR